ncbi:MAG TPA: glycoside hydrolase family 172 protein [Chloroflexota bacterium]|nr:glycoside hydrolase family 172 protein [Chloroflexota bacterium]
MAGGLFGELTRARDARSARFSSWDQTGRNQDPWVIAAGQTVTLADIEGPGCITHIWMTQSCARLLADRQVGDPDYYRKVLLKMYWDDQEHPSVLVPLGDFFCLGHSIANSFASLPFTSSVRPEQTYKFGGGAALNCYFQMPFRKRARIEITNENDVPYRQYFYVDYELYREELPEDTVYFHAQWRRENPTPSWDPRVVVNSPEANVVNLQEESRHNYVILEAEGHGHYVGCNLSVTNFQGTWWGEGDDMIFIDGEEWPPSLHGTGSEDYFNQAWGMQENAFPMCGSSIYEGRKPGYQTSYRFHLVDPVRFSTSIRVTMEHGHGNHSPNDWASTAYWYQTLPSKPFDILPMEQRLPIRHAELGVVPMLPPAEVPMLPGGPNDEMRRMSEQHRQKIEGQRREAAELAARRWGEAQEWSRRNTAHARELRERWTQERR